MKKIHLRQPLLMCYVIGNSYHIKRSAVDRTAAEWKMSINRPAAGGESRKRDSFLRYRKFRWNFL